MEPQIGSTSFQFRTPGIARTKMGAHVAYGVGFGCSLYGWKDNFKKLPMEQVSGPNSSGVDGNRLHKLTSRIYSGAATPSFGPCIMSGPIRGASKGSCMTLETILAAATFLLGFGFCLSYSVKNSSLIDRFVRPQLKCLINHLQFFQIVFFLVLVCVFDSHARISPRSEVNRAAHG
jgi:hypothetical protein